MIDSQKELLFQYRDSPRLRKIYDGLFTIFEKASPRDLMNILDLDKAEGEWLNLIGDIFNVPRWYANFNDAFTLDVDYIDEPSVVLDGLAGSISDVKYRALIKLSIYRRNKPFSIPNIYEVIHEAFKPLSIDIIEGDGEMTIDLVFKDISDLRVFNALYNIDNNLLGIPTGGKVTINRSVAE